MLVLLAIAESVPKQVPMPKPVSMPVPVSILVVACAVPGRDDLRTRCAFGFGLLGRIGCDVYGEHAA